MKCKRTALYLLQVFLIAFGLGVRSAQAQTYPDSANKIYSEIKNNTRFGLGDFLKQHPVRYVFLINTAQGASNPAVLTSSRSFISEFCKLALDDEKQYAEETRSQIAIRTYQKDLYNNEGRHSTLNDYEKLCDETIKFHHTNQGGTPYPDKDGGHGEAGPRNALLDEIHPFSEGRVNILIQITPNPVPQGSGPNQTEQGDSATYKLSPNFSNLDQVAFSWIAHDDKPIEYFCWLYGPSPLPSTGLVDRKLGPIPTTLTIAIDPASATINPGSTAKFTASVSDGSDVTFSKTGGTLESSGLTATYTAPDTPGTYTVTATANKDNSVSASAAITVSSPSSTDGQTGSIPGTGEVPKPTPNHLGPIIAILVVLLLVGGGAAYWFMQSSIVVIDGQTFSLKRLGTLKIVGDSSGARGGLKYTIPPTKLLQPRPGTIAEINFGVGDTIPTLRSQGLMIEAGGKRGRLVALKPDRETPVTFYTATPNGGNSNIATITIKIGKAKFS